MQYGLYAQLDFKLFVYVSGSGATEVVALRYKEAHPLAKRADGIQAGCGACWAGKPRRRQLREYELPYDVSPQRAHWRAEPPRSAVVRRHEPAQPNGGCFARR